MIDKSIISSLNPYKDRFDNYVKHYGDRSFTKAQFMGLKNITQEDKLWVSLRLMPKENIALAAADIAESVLHIFEAKYPNDDRPRKAIEAARTKDPKAVAYAADAAAKAAYVAADAADYAADAAANAAAYAAYAANATAYAAATYAAYAAHAADAAAYIADAYAADAYAADAVAHAADAVAHAADAYVADAYVADAVPKEEKPKQEKLIRKIIMRYWK